MHNRILFIFCVLIFSLTGCQAWEKTKSMYRGTIFPAQVDVEAKAGVSEEIRYLARLVTPVDTQLEELVRSTQGIGNPSERELQAMFSQFPWLNGLAAYRASGQRVHQVPAQPVKKISPQAVLDNLPSREEVDGLYLQVVEHDLGPELCLVKPIDNAGQVAAYVLVHFDPRSLFSRSPVPEDLLVLRNETVLWSGMQQDTTQRLMDKDWPSMLQAKVQGDFEVQTKSFVWLARYVGQAPLVYVVRTDKSDPQPTED
ncbi:MAG: hypothetical protein U5L00_05570 [Desulfovermiculus sp.]|nr:hypothetical protein [Desulfovermiculus sp.]